MSKSQRKWVTFGGSGGGEFAAQVVKSFGVYSGQEVDRIILNGTRYGGEGGGHRGEITLGSDEYFNYLKIRSGQRIDNIYLKTNKGRAYGPHGGNGGGEQVHKNIRIFQIRGRSGARVDRLEFEIVTDYEPSSAHRVGRDLLISEVLEPGSQYEYYESSRLRKLEACRTMLEVSMTVGASAEVELLGSMYAELSVTTQQELVQETESEKSFAKTKTYNISGDQIGLMVSEVDVRKTGDLVWFVPTSVTTLVMKKPTELAAHFKEKRVWDATGALDVQIPTRKPSKEGGVEYYQFY